MSELGREERENSVSVEVGHTEDDQRIHYPLGEGVWGGRGLQVCVGK